MRRGQRRASALVDVRAYMDNAPPPHNLHREDEAFFVLEGEFPHLVGDRTVGAAAGSFLFAPKGTVRTYASTGAEPGRLLVVLAPAGLEKFFEAVGEPVADPSTLPGANPRVIEKVPALAPQYGVEIVGPEGKQESA